MSPVELTILAAAGAVIFGAGVLCGWALYAERKPDLDAEWREMQRVWRNDEGASW